MTYILVEYGSICAPKMFALCPVSTTAVHTSGHGCVPPSPSSGSARHIRTVVSSPPVRSSEPPWAQLTAFTHLLGRPSELVQAINECWERIARTQYVRSPYCSLAPAPGPVVVQARVPANAFWIVLHALLQSVHQQSGPDVGAIVRDEILSRCGRQPCSASRTKKAVVDTMMRPESCVWESRRV